MQTPVPVYMITEPVMGEVSWSGVRPMPSPRMVTPAGIVSVPVVRYTPGGLRVEQARQRPRVDVSGPAWRGVQGEYQARRCKGGRARTKTQANQYCTTPP